MGLSTAKKQELDNQVGDTKETYCKKCKHKTDWVFCKYDGTFTDDYYWECPTCNEKQYVAKNV